MRKTKAITIIYKLKDPCLQDKNVAAHTACQEHHQMMYWFISDVYSIGGRKQFAVL